MTARAQVPFESASVIARRFAGSATLCGTIFMGGI